MGILRRVVYISSDFTGGRNKRLQDVTADSSKFPVYLVLPATTNADSPVKKTHPTIQSQSASPLGPPDSVSSQVGTSQAAIWRLCPWPPSRPAP